MSTTKEESLKQLKSWFQENPKLPADIDPLLLLRFFKCMHYDVDETKNLILMNYGMRFKNPKIFIERDPEITKALGIFERYDILPLPGLTPERNKLLFFRLNKCDPKSLNNVMEANYFYVLSDCRFIDLDAERDSENLGDSEKIDEDHYMADGEIQILDIANWTLSHIARISFMVLRTYLKFLQEAYPVRLKAIHVINCPSFLDKMITIVRPFIRDEVYKMVHFHTKAIETLYEHVPRDMLPDEYGGKAGDLQCLKQKTLRNIEEKRLFNGFKTLESVAEKEFLATPI